MSKRQDSPERPEAVDVATALSDMREHPGRRYKCYGVSYRYNAAKGRLEFLSREIWKCTGLSPGPCCAAADGPKRWHRE